MFYNFCTHKTKLTFVTFISSVLFVLTGCLPKEVSNQPPVETPVSYQEFNGIVSAETLNDNRVLIKWNPSSDTKVAAYNIYDSTFRFAPKLIRTVTAPASQVTINGLATQSLYSFRVRAADADNLEDANVKDLKAIPYSGIISSQVISSTSARLEYTTAPDVDEVQVSCKTTGEYERVATIRNPGVHHTIINSLTPGITYTCRAAVSIDGFADNNPAVTTFIPMGQASELVFSTQPGNAAAGQSFTAQPVITVRDANGNVVAGGPDSTVMITLTVATASPTTGIVNGTVNVAAVAGVATFAGLNINESGVKIISATKADTSASEFGTPSMSVNSNTFTITPGPASPDTSLIAISPSVPPADPLIANGTDSYTVSITLRDQYNNYISGVRPQFGSNVAGDTLSQPTVNTNATGVTTGAISATTADTAPSLVRRIHISSPTGLSSVTTAAPFKHGMPTKLAFLIQPTNSPAGIMGMNAMQIAIQDAQGNTITTGAAATGEVTLSIASNVNGAVLSGTNPRYAVDGMTSFSDIGIDLTGTGYKLVASSGALSPAYSNSFNVTPGVPKKISLSGPANTLSGNCSTAMTVQLQDLGSNPANAIQNTPVTIGGLGSASMYSASNCSGTALSTTMVFTAGTHTRTVYLRNNAAQGLTITATDSSATMTQGNLATTFSPKKIGLLAQAASPAAPGTPLKVAAKACSTEILITPMGQNGVAGPTFMPTQVAVTGLGSSAAIIYSDASCTTVVNPTNITLPINSGPSYAYKFYLKDPRAEVLSLSVTDPNGVLETTTAPQGVTVTASDIHLAGPTSVVAGQCSTAFTVNLKDGEMTDSTPTADMSLTINGISELTTGRLYLSPSCTGSPLHASTTFPAGQSSLLLYFKGSGSGTYNINFSDPASILATSQTVSLKVSPSTLRITGVGTSSNTNICAGPFQVQTLDSLNQLSNAVTPITVNLTGEGVSGGYYTDAQCKVGTSNVTFLAGENQKTIYYMGYYPEASLTLTATDANAILTPATKTWAVTGKPAWIGTAAKETDENGVQLWFRQNAKPVAARYDGIFSANRLAMDPTKQYLYIADADMHRVIKYDYINRTYIGWVGAFANVGGITIVGSHLPTPSSAQCASTLSTYATPGWCYGGQSYAHTNTSTGRMYTPESIVEDGQYLYVANVNGDSINRYNAQTGAFAGFIGWISNNSGMIAAPGGPGDCSSVGSNVVTPGWCMSSTTAGVNGNLTQTNPTDADGRIETPRGLAYDNDYLYVANYNNISRYNKASGAFAGWIGRVSATPTSGAAGCTSTIGGQQTPGWCYGGSSENAYILTAPIGGIDSAITGLYILNGHLLAVRSNGAIVKYDPDSGAVVGPLSSLTLNWSGTYQMATDGAKLYFSDYQRVIKTDMNGLVESWMGKVAVNNSMSGNPGCSTLAVNDDTPGWCLGGTSRPGFDKTSFRQLTGMVYDGNGKLIVGQVSGSGTVRRYNIVDGSYDGTLSLESVGPTRWSNDAVTPTERNGFDDTTLFNPTGVLSVGDDLFVSDFSASRIKKINRRTGAVDGWIGVVTSRPSGGLDPACLLANPFAASPGWCSGANFLPNSMFWNASMINTSANGIMHSPVGLASDNTFLYVSDYELHRITRYRISTGQAEGWIGNIAVSPTGGSPGCNGATVGTFTPGWCTGGRSQSGSGDGDMNRPIELVVHSGNIYVADRGNQRISSYNLLTGAFNGWIGRIATTPTSGCTVGNNGNYDISFSGWCKGGTAQESSNNDRGGGFRFLASYTGGLTTDGTYLYVANFYPGRIDRYNFDGEFLGATRTREDQYTNGWTADKDQVAALYSGCSYPVSIWTDGTHMYGTNWQPCTRNGDSMSVWKMNLASGQMVGWQGGIFSSNLPHAGEPGCAGATEKTPGWCVGGAVTMGLRLGQFSGTAGFVTGDQHFIYVSDVTGNRITRFPK